MMNVFTFDDIVSSDYGVYISGSGVFNAASRDITTLEIPGRDGVLTMDNGRFNTTKHEYPAFVVPPFDTNIQELRNALMSKRGFKKLSDTYHPDEYYLAYFEDGLEIEPTKNLKAGELTISFVRDPRRFLTIGDAAVELTADGSVNNPTLFDSRPLLRVYGTGQLGIGSDTITISTADVYTDIDCEMRECFKGTVSKNYNVSFTSDDFPTLHPGVNGIDLGTGITKVEIIPRWYRL